MAALRDDQIRELLRLHFRGCSIHQIAHDIGCSWQNVLYVLIARGIKPSRPDRGGGYGVTGMKAIDFTWVGGRNSREVIDPDWDDS